MPTRLVIAILFFTLCSGCSTVPQKKYDQDIANERTKYNEAVDKYNSTIDSKNKDILALQNRINELTIQIDELINAPKRLISIARSQIDENKLKEAQLTLKLLKEKHPESDEWTKLGVGMQGEIKNKLDNIEAASLQQEKENNKRIAAAMKLLNKETDVFNGVDWYRDKTSPKYVNVNGFFIYFGVKDNVPQGVWLKIQYSGQEELNITSYLLKTDSNKYTIDINQNFKKHGSADTGGWESYETNGSIFPSIYDSNSKYCSLYSVLNDVVNSRTAILRMIGSNFSRDRTITKDEIAAIKNTLDGYHNLGGSDK